MVLQKEHNDTITRSQTLSARAGSWFNVGATRLMLFPETEIFDLVKRSLDLEFGAIFIEGAEEKLQKMTGSQEDKEALTSFIKKIGKLINNLNSKSNTLFKIINKVQNRKVELKVSSSKLLDSYVKDKK